jgi:hypothetical protein
LNLIRVMPAKGQDNSMANSVFLARLIGPLGLALGIGLLLDSGGYRTMASEFLGSRALTFLAGIITLPAGLAIVLTHNVWTPDWRVVITLLGWLLIIYSPVTSGVLRIIAPQLAIDWGRSATAKPVVFKIGGAVWLAIGALLCFFGYLR